MTPTALRPASDPPAADARRKDDGLDWLVVGGGVHGTHVAAALVDAFGAEAVKLRVLDPHPTPLANWEKVTARVGMPFLRSPVVHHLGRNAMELANFAGTSRARSRGGHFRGRYRRPSLTLFNRHARAVAREAGLAERWIVGSARRMSRGGDGVWEVETNEEILRARNVVLAIGGNHGMWPDWAEGLRGQTEAGTISHVFGPGTDLMPEGLGDDPRPDVVVGAGMSGTQLALHLARLGRRVVLVSRRVIPVTRFDTEPGWLGPKHMAAFDREPCPDARRRIIQDARHRGSITEDVHHALRAAEQAGEVEHRLGEILGAAPAKSGVLLTLGETRPTGDAAGAAASLPRVLEARRVFLATGNAPGRPGGRWLDEAVRREALPTASCGFPIPDAALRWRSGLFVTGPLAELELGPVSRNIAGARRAAERIVAVATAATS